MSDIDNLFRPPQEELEAEQAVLGSLLIDPDIAPALFAAVKPDDFCFTQNKELFCVARKLYRQGSPLDAVTLNGACAEIKGDFAGGGVAQYLCQLMEITPTSANWEEYAKIMKEKSAFWKVKRAAYTLYSDPQTLDDCRQIAEEINALLNSRHAHKPHTMRDSILSFLNRQDEPPPEYLRYGIPELDRMMFTERGDVVVIGGSPSSGKTAFALSVAWRLAESRKVAFFSLETHKRKIDDRLIAHNAPVSLSLIKDQARFHRDESAWEKIFKATHMYERNNLHIYTTEEAPLTLADIENITRAYGYEAIFIDYVQELLSGYGSGYFKNIRERVTEISMELHKFAQSTKTTVFELAQLSRQTKGAWEEPTMFDLKESGQLEQDADAVFLIYRPPKNHKTLDENKNRFLKVAKNKEGKTGSLILDFDGETQSFSVHKGDEKEIMRNLSDIGRAAKTRNRANATETAEQIPIPDDYEMPF